MDHKQPKPFAAIRSSAIDGRVHNPFFRRLQLRKLHQGLAKRISELQDALGKDKSLTLDEIKIECLLALQCVAHAHECIDPHKTLADEYAITRGVDAFEARTPIGVVVIEPPQHGFLYGLISALAPALASGNCIIVEYVQPLAVLPQLVLDIVGAALDDDIFTVSNRPVTVAELAHPHVRVVQDSARAVKEDRHLLVSTSSSPVLALVERDAHVEDAARELVTACFSRGGKSPYAPDLILVNEWVKKPFIEAVLNQRVASGAKNEHVGGDGRLSALDEDAEEEDYVVIYSGSKGDILDVRSRKPAALRRKFQHPSLVIHAVKSIDDAINVAKLFGRLGAAYVFAKPPAAKYFCQFIDTSVSFINQVPTKLLYGPMAPAGHSVHPNDSSVYDTNMFTISRPQFISVSNVDCQLHCCSQGDDLNNLLAQATKELLDIKRPSHVSPIGFFEQGIITGLSMLLVAIVGGMSVSGYFLFGYFRSK